MLDRDGSVDVEIFWQYESFVGDQIVDRFDESFVDFQIALENMDIHIVVIDVLFHEFAEFCNQLHLLHSERIIALKYRDVRGFG